MDRHQSRQYHGRSLETDPAELAFGIPAAGSAIVRLACSSSAIGRSAQLPSCDDHGESQHQDKLERDPRKAAPAYALLGTVGYDAFIASQDGKFTYWYLRPAQLDTSLVPLFPAPNFPSYPSNHSVLSTARAEVLAYLFPDRAEQIRALGKQAGVTLGENMAQKFITWAESDGLNAAART